MRHSLTLPILWLMTVGTIAQAPLSEESVKEAIALGKSCGDVPLVKIGKAKLKWVVSIDGRKMESETYKILAVLTKKQ
jgi:hypothetical protein